MQTGKTREKSGRLGASVGGSSPGIGRRDLPRRREAGLGAGAGR